MTVSYSVRAEQPVIDNAKEVARSYGMDSASVTRALWAQKSRTGAIPLVFSRETPNDASRESIRQTRDVICAGSGEAYSNVADFVTALEA